MRIYVSGPMTGHPDLNRPAFDAAAKRLRDEGHFVINPHDLTMLFGTPQEVSDSFRCLYLGFSRSGQGTSELALYLIDAELAAVRSCDAIYLLRGWNDSRGAKMELQEALKHNLKILVEGEEQ